MTTLAPLAYGPAGAFGLLAQTSRPATSQPVPWWVGLTQSPMPLIVTAFVVFYAFMISSRRKQDKQKKDALGSIKRGDRVQTIGGILGKVVEADENKVLLKVDESSNTKIWFSRTAIHRVVEEEKGEAK